MSASKAPNIIFESSYPLKPTLSTGQKVVISVTVTLALVAIGLGVLALESSGGANVGIFHRLGSMGDVSAWLMISSGGAALGVLCVVFIEKAVQAIRFLRVRATIRENESLIEVNFQQLKQSKDSKAFVPISYGQFLESAIILKKDGDEFNLMIVESHFDSLQSELATQNYKQFLQIKRSSLQSSAKKGSELPRKAKSEADFDPERKIHIESDSVGDAEGIVNENIELIEANFNSFLKGNFETLADGFVCTRKFMLLPTKEYKFILVSEKQERYVYVFPAENEEVVMEKMGDLGGDTTSMMYMPEEI